MPASTNQPVPADAGDDRPVTRAELEEIQIRARSIVRMTAPWRSSCSSWCSWRPWRSWPRARTAGCGRSLHVPVSGCAALVGRRRGPGPAARLPRAAA